MQTTKLSVRCATKDAEVVRAWLDKYANIDETIPAKITTRFGATVTRREGLLKLGIDGDCPTIKVPVRWGLLEIEHDEVQRSEAGVYVPPLKEPGLSGMCVVASTDGVNPNVTVRMDDGVPTMDAAEWRASVRFLYLVEAFTTYYRGTSHG